MTGVALDLLRQVTETGGTVRLDGDVLRLSAPEPLPGELRTCLRQHKAEIVALLAAAKPDPESTADLPPEIVEGVRAILSADGARGIPPQRWPRVQRDVVRLIEAGRLERALALGALAPAPPGRAGAADRRA
jgi:hypothetical protein